MNKSGSLNRGQLNELIKGNEKLLSFGVPQSEALRKVLQ